MGLTAAFFWRIFEETGSIAAYLAYKQFYLRKNVKKSRENFI